MNKLVQLVNEWDKFEKNNSKATIDEFCRYYLNRKKAATQKLAGGIIPTGQTSLLMKIIARITGAFSVYQKLAMAEAGLPFPDAYFYLHGLFNLGEIKKTELINYLLAEYTTGITGIDKLINYSLIDERPGKTDKRVKLISLSKKGEKLLQKCYKNAGKPGQMIFNSLSEKDIKFCINLLSAIEIKHSALAVKYKTETFDTMYLQAMNNG